MTILDAVAVDAQNIGVVLVGDQRIRDGLRQSARLGSKSNEEIVMLKAQIARFANAVIDKGMLILGQAE